MNNPSDFIIENGVLKNTLGPAGMWPCRRV